MQNLKTTSIAIVAVLLTIGSLWLSNRATTPKQTSWDNVFAEAKTGGYKIITTVELSNRYQKDAGDLRIVDTRQEWEFRTGHIKGAVNFPMEPTPWERWRKASIMEEFLGADKNQAIVFY